MLGFGRVSGLILGSKNAIFRVKIAKKILIVGEKFIYKKQQKNMGRIAYVEPCRTDMVVNFSEKTKFPPKYRQFCSNF